MDFVTFKLFLVCLIATGSLLARGDNHDDKYDDEDDGGYIENDYSYDEDEYYKSYDENDDKQRDDGKNDDKNDDTNDDTNDDKSNDQNDDQNNDNNNIENNGENYDEKENEINNPLDEQILSKKQLPNENTPIKTYPNPNYPIESLPIKQYQTKPTTKDHQPGTPGCRSAGLCCQGKDNNCLTKGSRMNGNNNDTCYCDSTCLPLQDCCTDYASHCREVSCVLGQWSEWSECNVPCGFGVRHRGRGVIQDPRNGGPACEVTTQKQVCEGVSCKHTRGTGSSGEELRETARILSLKYGHWREAYKYNPLKDIRRNIYHHLGHNSSQRSQLTYCGVYRLEYVQPTCRNAPTSSLTPSPLPTLSHETQILLEKGVRVCVECQHTAISEELGGRCYGHGVEGKTTKWTSLENGKCRGTWVLEERNHQCSCQHQHPSVPAFIFV